MTIVVGILAMFVAFAALWLGSTAMRKAEDQYTELANAIRAELAKLRGDMNEKVNVATSRVATLEARLDKIQALDQATHDALTGVRDELVALKRDLAATQTALPPQIRARVKAGEPRANN